jgi:uncharacterized membrane protein YdbT with pleckstrin-like domain
LLFEEGLEDDEVEAGEVEADEVEADEVEDDEVEDDEVEDDEADEVEVDEVEAEEPDDGLDPDLDEAEKNPSTVGETACAAFCRDRRFSPISSTSCTFS